MEKRRGHGEGSVYQRKDKDGKLIPNSWVAQGTYDGKRKTFITHSAIFPFTIKDVTQADMAAIPYLIMERMGEQVVFRIKENI